MDTGNNKKHNSEKSGINRRSMLKSLAGVPVLGLFGLETLKFYEHKSIGAVENQQVLADLGIDHFNIPKAKRSSADKADLIRIGIIGYGWRAGILANGLGFLHPEEAKKRKASGRLESWLKQEDLNVAITGICEVFDDRAEGGMATAAGDIRSGGAVKSSLPVKRYRTYQEMLDSKDIDAVIIATPDHHHAQMTIDAIKAGKHVYCEKCFTRTEQELYEAYDVISNSDLVFQLGHQITKNVVFQYAKEIIKKGLLGKITLVEATSNRNTEHGAWIRHLDKAGNPKAGSSQSIDWNQWLGSRPKVPFSIDRYYNWTKWFDYSTGLLGQLFTHEFDAINQLLHIGIPSSVMASGGIYYWKDNREIPDMMNAVFEYPDKDLTLVYSANLANSRQRGRVIMGNDASMEIGGSLSLTPDGDSARYADKLAAGDIDSSYPMFSVGRNSSVDAVSSATAKYYTSRGLSDTVINGAQVSVTHLHLKEWVDCIRNGGTPTGNIDMAFEEGIAVLMAHKSYLEKRKVEWDPIKRRMV